MTDLLDQIEISFFRSSGPGGQRKNKRETAVRVTHLPTGITVTGQIYRSQVQNKEYALEILKKRLAQFCRKRKRRIPTRVSRSAKEKTREEKQRHGLKKELRSASRHIGRMMASDEI